MSASIAAAMRGSDMSWPAWAIPAWAAWSRARASGAPAPAAGCALWAWACAESSPPGSGTGLRAPYASATSPASSAAVVAPRWTVTWATSWAASTCTPRTCGLARRRRSTIRAQPSQAMRPVRTLSVSVSAWSSCPAWRAWSRAVPGTAPLLHLCDPALLGGDDLPGRLLDLRPLRPRVGLLRVLNRVPVVRDHDTDELPVERRRPARAASNPPTVIHPPGGPSDTHRARLHCGLAHHR